MKIFPDKICIECKEWYIDGDDVECDIAGECIGEQKDFEDAEEREIKHNYVIIKELSRYQFYVELPVDEFYEKYFIDECPYRLEHLMMEKE